LSKKPNRRDEERSHTEISRLKVVLDSNFLITPIEYHIDIFDQIPRVLGRKTELIIPTAVYKELKRIMKTANRKRASLALTLAKKCRIVETPTEKGEDVDDVIIRLAQSWKTPVATNDRELRERLRAIGIPVISMRGKGRLELHGVAQ